MTLELIVETLESHFKVDLSYEQDNWFRFKLNGRQFQGGFEDGLFKISIDLKQIGYDTDYSEVENRMKRINKEIGKGKRVYLGEADYFYRVFVKDNILKTVKDREDIIDLMNELIEFGTNEKLKYY